MTRHRASRGKHGDEEEEEAEEEVGQAPSPDRRASRTARIKSRGDGGTVCRVSLASFAVVPDDELVVQVVTGFLRPHRRARRPSVEPPVRVLCRARVFPFAPYTFDTTGRARYGAECPDIWPVGSVKLYS